MGELTVHKMEPAAKALAATAMSQTLSFCMERKYLENISDDEAIVFRVKEFEGECTLIVETDEEVAEAVFDEYYMLLDEAEDD